MTVCSNCDYRSKNLTQVIRRRRHFWQKNNDFFTYNIDRHGSFVHGWLLIVAAVNQSLLRHAPLKVANVCEFLLQFVHSFISERTESQTWLAYFKANGRQHSLRAPRDAETCVPEVRGHRLTRTLVCLLI